jgi:hypothetical protein
MMFRGKKYMKPSFFITLIMIFFIIVFNCSMARLPSGWEIVDKSQRPLVEYYARIGCPDSINCMIWIARNIYSFDTHSLSNGMYIVKISLDGILICTNQFILDK